MLKKIILVLFGFVFLFSYNLVFASPIINEFMYDLDGADIDWVEIYNGDSTDVDITTLKLFISNSTSNHGIIKYSGSQILNEGEYGIIVPTSQISAFTSRWGDSGNLFTSSFSLPNESATIEINNGDKNLPLDSVSYTSAAGGSGDENSLSGSLIPSTPTPGAENQTSSGDNGDGNNDDDNSDSGTTSDSSSKKNDVETIQKLLVNKIKIIVKSPAFVGVPVEFTVNNTVPENSCGKYFWNFGDGNSEETGKMYPIPKKFTHIYYYEGEYIVTLECYKSYLSLEPETSDKITLKVVPADILISRVGDEKDFFVEISNNTSFEADISNWILLSNWKKFVFPKNSILKPKNKIIISSKITNFSLGDESTLRLLNSQGEVVFDYLSFIEPVKVLAKNYTQPKVAVSEPVDNTFNIVDVAGNNIEIKKMIASSTGLNGLVDNLSAEVIKSDVNVKDNFKYGIFGLIAFLGIGTSAAYFVRNRNRKPTLETNENDFEIIDG